MELVGTKKSGEDSETPPRCVGEGRREKGEGRREREKGEGRKEKGEGRKERGEDPQHCGPGETIREETERWETRDRR